MEKFSLSDIKKKNRSDIYHFIYTNPGSSRQSIANALNMSLPTVTQHLTSLSEEGFIEKAGQLSSNIGRKATAYSAVMNARIAIGVEILGDMAFLVAIDLSGHKIAKEKIPLQFSTGDDYFETLSINIYSILKKQNIPADQLLGIGLGIQGLVSSDGRTVIYGRILDCTGLTIDAFQRFFQAPCRFIHDAECAAISELWDNPALENAIYLSLGDHLGGAVILEGKLQRGISGKSGTFEHMILVPDGKPCYCGKRGCAECYCSASALLEGTIDFQKLDSFFEQKSAGNSECINRWHTYLHDLAVLINNLHMVIENTIILGGHITPYFEDQDVDFLRREVFSLSTFGDPADYILPGKCRVDAVSRGSALPFVQEFLQTL